MSWFRKNKKTEEEIKMEQPLSKNLMKELSEALNQKFTSVVIQDTHMYLSEDQIIGILSPSKKPDNPKYQIISIDRLEVKGDNIGLGNSFVNKNLFNTLANKIDARIAIVNISSPAPIILQDSRGFINIAPVLM